MEFELKLGQEIRVHLRDLENTTVLVAEGSVELLTRDEQGLYRVFLSGAPDIYPYQIWYKPSWLGSVGKLFLAASPTKASIDRFYNGKIERL
jgi:hypothetical protein